MLPTFIAHAPPFARLMDEGGVPRLVDDLAAGHTLKDVASRIGCTRGALARWIAQLPEADQAAIRTADTQGVTAMVEETKQIADDTAEEIRAPRRMVAKSGEIVEVDAPATAVIAAAKVQIEARQWIAERKDKEQWGGKAQTEVTVNFNAVFLDVLRQRSRPAAPIEIQTPAVITVGDFL